MKTIETTAVNQPPALRRSARFCLEADGTLLLVSSSGSPLFRFTHTGDFCYDAIIVDPLYEAIVDLIQQERSASKERKKAVRALRHILNRPSARGIAWEYLKKKKARDNAAAAHCLGSTVPPAQPGQGSASDRALPLENTPAPKEAVIMKTPTTKEYIARLNLQDAQCTIISNTLQNVQDNVQSLVQHKGIRFEEGSGGSIYLYHDKFFNGVAPFGWITEYDVPQNLSTHNRLENLRNMATETSHSGR